MFYVLKHWNHWQFRNYFSINISEGQSFINTLLLILEQPKFELCGSIYTQVFFFFLSKYYDITLSTVDWIGRYGGTVYMELY